MMNVIIRSIFAAALASITLAGCDVAGLDEDWGRRPAKVLVTADGPEIYAPDTVRAGVAFPVQIFTRGNGCLRRGETTAQVNQQERVAQLFPFDYERTGARLCTEEFRRFEHSIQIIFDNPGMGTLHVHSATPDGVQTFAPVVLTRTVTVVR